jgi:tRNA pseudouridine55 synthase
MARRKKGDAVHGWICLDKPYDFGSTDAVSRVRRLFNAQKAGHAGTLDPLATGVLPIALGEATKTVSFLMEADKTYRFTIRWGETTDSFDREGRTIATSDVRPTPDAVAAVLPRFVGAIQQVPPAFSAVRVGGERAYDLARAGEAVALEPREVVIHAAEVTAAPDADHVEITLTCGKGTYVRAIVRDLAEALGACGHVSALRRTRVGPFEEAGAVTLESLADLCHTPGRREVLLPVETALDDIPALAVTAEDAFRLSQGRAVVLLPRQVEQLRSQLSLSSRGGEDRTVSAMAGESIAAICELRAGRLNPVRVFQL